MSIDERLRAAGLPPLYRPVWLEIDVPALVGNLGVIQDRVGPQVEVWPVVKADGYGHGIEVAARAFLSAGAAGVCVATLDEALAVRKAGIEGPVLILYPIPVDSVEDAARQGFQLAVSTGEDALALADHWVATSATTRGLTLRLHLEVETGLARMGVPTDDAPALVKRLSASGLVTSAIWSHLATPEDPATSADQENRLTGAVVATWGVHPHPAASHLAATGGLLRGVGTGAALVRPGLLTYGVRPSADAPMFPGLRPAMRLKAQALRVVDVPVGTSVGYGGTWVARRASRIATLPVGYGDGYARALSGSPALVRGVRVPVVGVVSMDALMVDVTDVPDVDRNDEFVLLGRQGTDELTALELARWRTTIPWEVVTGMTRRPTRVYDASVGLLGVRTLAGETLVQDASWS